MSNLSNPVVITALGLAPLASPTLTGNVTVTGQLSETSPADGATILGAGAAGSGQGYLRFGNGTDWRIGVDGSGAAQAKLIGRYSSTQAFSFTSGGLFALNQYSSGSPTLVAGDKYIVVDVSGNIHTSALGPLT